MAKRKTTENAFASFNVLIPVDTLDEIKSFFPIQTKVNAKYANLSLKVKENGLGQKEIFYEGTKPFSRIVDIAKEYTDEEVIFYTYVLLQSQYDWFYSSKDSNLAVFCHDFFTKANKYTSKQQRDDYTDKRMFEMFLYNSVKTSEEYDLPPLEEMWRIFRTKKPLMYSTYNVLFENEKNSIRKLDLSEKAFAEMSAYRYLEYNLVEYFSKREYKKYIDTYLLHKTFLSEEATFPYTAILYFNFIESCVNSNQFEIAENNLKNEDIRFFNGNYNKDFFEGVILYYKKDFVNAEISFKEAILYDEERESGSVKVSTIFYLLCLLHLKRDYLASSFIYNLQPLKLKDESNEWIDNFNIPEKQEGLISGLEKLKLNEEQKASLLYYKTCLIGEKRTMTREDATKIIKNLKEIKLGYSREFEYQFYLSTAFYTLGSYDKAYEHKIRASFVKAEDTYVEPLANIEKTSEEFKNGLIKTIKKYVEEDARNKPDNYIESELSEVVDYFWEKKRYFLIAELYHYVEDNSELYLPDEYLFHFGYSLKENDEPEEAKKCYERSLENKNKSSSVLNNLAIIYEKEGNLKRAKELILEAFSLTDGSDEIVNRNKVRLIAPKKKMVQQGARNQVKVIEPIHHITYDTIRDIITYKDGKTLTLRNGDNITKIICEIFRKPKSAHLEQDLLDLIGSDGNRTIYDAVVNINKKFRSLGAKSNLLTFSSGKVTVTLEYVNDLKIIEPS